MGESTQMQQPCRYLFCIQNKFIFQISKKSNDENVPSIGDDDFCVFSFIRPNS
jgi:hypothetical protein